MDFRLRPMEDCDLDQTFEWRNDPVVLKGAMTPNPISRNEHDAVFKYGNTIKLIFEVDNSPKGFVSVSRDEYGESGEWSFHMSKEGRGQGLAKIMLGAALYYMKKVEGYEYITSAVLPDNEISIYLHEQLGFTPMEDEGHFKKYYINL